MGIVGACLEIEWTKKIMDLQILPQLQWYYLGWYTPSKQNMRYKKDFLNQYILCPFTKRYVAFSEEIIKQIDEGKNFTLSKENTLEIEDFRYESEEQMIDFAVMNCKFLQPDNNIIYMYQLDNVKTMERFSQKMAKVMSENLGKTLLRSMIFVIGLGISFVVVFIAANIDDPKPKPKPKTNTFHLHSK